MVPAGGDAYLRVQVVGDGPARAHDYVVQSRRLEVALSQVKAKLYGSTYAVRRPW